MDTLTLSERSSSFMIKPPSEEMASTKVLLASFSRRSNFKGLSENK